MESKLSGPLLAHIWCYLRPNSLDFRECAYVNDYMWYHTPVGGSGVLLKGMDVLTVNHHRERSILGQKKKRWLEQIVQMLKSGQLSFLSASGVDLAGTGVKGLPGTAPVADPETSQVTTAID